MPGIGDLAKAVKSELDARYAQSAKHVAHSMSDKLIGEIVSSVFDKIHQFTDGGQVVSIQGHGNYRVMPRKATTARNPRTGARFKVPASKRFKFTTSKTRKDELNGRLPAPTPAKVAKAAKAAAKP